MRASVESLCRLTPGRESDCLHGIRSRSGQFAYEVNGHIIQVTHNPLVVLAGDPNLTKQHVEIHVPWDRLGDQPWSAIVVCMQRLPVCSSAYSQEQVVLCINDVHGRSHVVHRR